MRKMTREQLQTSYDAKSKEADLLNLYLVDREYFEKTPIRAQWSDEKDTIYDAAWYRADSASEGYIVIRYFLLTDGRKGNPEGMPSIYSFTDLSEQRFSSMPAFAAYIVERLRRNRYRLIGCPDVPGTVSSAHFAHSDRVHQGFCYHCQVWLTSNAKHHAKDSLENLLACDMPKCDCSHFHYQTDSEPISAAAGA